MAICGEKQPPCSPEIPGDGAGQGNMSHAFSPILSAQLLWPQAKVQAESGHDLYFGNELVHFVFQEAKIPSVHALIYLLL